MFRKTFSIPLESSLDFGKAGHDACNASIEGRATPNEDCFVFAFYFGSQVREAGQVIACPASPLHHSVRPKAVKKGSNVDI